MEKNGNRPKRDQANTADSTTSKKKDKKVDSAGTTAAQANSAKIEEIDAYTASAGGAYTAEAPTGRYIFDSGASEHMTPHRHLLTEYKAIAPIPINAANNSSFNAVGRGYLSVEVPNGHSKTRLKLKNVLYAPGMHATLVSLGKLDAAGFSSTISGNTLHLQCAGCTYVTIPRKAGLYSIGAYSAQAAAEPPVIKLALNQLHCRLGHRNHKAILKMYTDGRLPGIKLTLRDITECRDCLLSKATHAPIAAKWMSPLAAKFGDHVHLDVWGPATVRSLLEHAHYVLIIMDDATCWAEAPIMQHKSDAFAKYVAWEAREELHSNVHVKINQSDRGGEFLSNDWEMYLQRKGTIRKLTVHNTPEHNGVTERFWRTIFNGVRALLSASGLPRNLWAEALRWAVWIYNRSPHATLEGMSPFEKRYSSPPDLSRAWEWGTWVYVHRPAGKLETYASEGRWIGLDDTSNGHRIYWSDQRTITVERSIRPSTCPMRVNEGEQDHLDIGPEDSSDV
jgi:transposase InsO family protein